MSSEKWTVNFVVSRQKADSDRSFQSYLLEVDPEEYVLDGVERIWAFKDRSLVFRHACHHSTCGACGMLVNGVEKLTCITTIRSVTHNGGTLKIEPLRNFPVVSDLAVDMTSLYSRLETTGFTQYAPVEDACLPFEKNLPENKGESFERLVDCIECGCCISACPAAMTSTAYLGPAVLAAIQHDYLHRDDMHLLDLADHHDGVWRCHSAYECSAVCPSNVDPGWRIMNLRQRIIGRQFQKLFGKKEHGKS